MGDDDAGGYTGPATVTVDGRGPVEVVLDRVRRGDADLDGVPAALLGAVERALAVRPADRPHALRAARDERLTALRGLNERRAFVRQAERLLRRVSAPAPR